MFSRLLVVFFVVCNTAALERREVVQELLIHHGHVLKPHERAAIFAHTRARKLSDWSLERAMIAAIAQATARDVYSYDKRAGRWLTPDVKGISRPLSPNCRPEKLQNMKESYARKVQSDLERFVYSLKYPNVAQVSPEEQENYNTEKHRLEKEYECPLCLQSMYQAVRTTGCLSPHQFHSNCIMQVYKRSLAIDVIPSCPICRALLHINWQLTKTELGNYITLGRTHGFQIKPKRN